MEPKEQNTPTTVSPSSQPQQKMEGAPDVPVSQMAESLQAPAPASLDKSTSNDIEAISISDTNPDNDAAEEKTTVDEQPWPTSQGAANSFDTRPGDTDADVNHQSGSIIAEPDTKLLNQEALPTVEDMGHPEGIIPPPPITPAAGSSKKPGRRWLVMSMIIILLLAIAGGAYAAYHATKKETTQTLPHIKVGVMMAFTGGSSSMGYGAMKGIQLAKKQLGAENIEITQMDSKCDPKSAAEAVKKLIALHVAAIIGEGCSSASVAALPAANNSKTVMVSPSASSTTLSIPDDYFFRVVPPDTFQGEYIAQSIYDKGIRTVAVFYTNEPYGSSMNKVFQEKFEALGGKVVATASGEPDVIDLKNQMTELKAANPQAIFFAPNSVVSGTAAMKIGREIGVNAPYYGADILYNTTIIDDAPTATEGLTITSFPTGSKPFKQALMNMNDQVNEQLYAAPQAYDAFHAIYIATQRGASTGEEIKKQLPNISFDGVSAHIVFDQNGEISEKGYKYDLLKVKDGIFVTAE